MSKVRPLRSTGITPLPHYYGPLRLPIQPDEGYLFPPTVGDLPPPYRVSQVPQHIFPRALSPITPECPAGACVCFFPTGNRLHPIRKVGHTHWCNEAETGSLALGLTRSWSGGTVPFAFIQTKDRPASHDWLPSRKGSPLHSEQTITMADSFQSARCARLILAHQICTDKDKSVSNRR